MLSFEKIYLNILKEESESYIQPVQTLFIITGVPGSGKSTIANKIKEEYELAGLEIPKHYEADMWFIKDGKYQWFKEGLSKAHQWCQSKTKDALLNGKSVIVSNTSLSPRDRKPYVDFAKENNINIKFIEAKGQFQNIHNVPNEIVNSMRDKYIPITNDEINIIKEDTTGISIEQIEKNIIKNLINKEKLLNTNKKFKLTQVSKYFLDCSPSITYYVLKNNNLIKAICVADITDNICKIMQIGSLEKGKGYGEILLKYFLNQPFKMIYLSADWESPDKLLEFYRRKEFGLKEYKNPISQIHWFYKNRMLTFDRMNKIIEKKFH